MAQVLVIYAHPVPHRSRVNRRLADTARALPGVTVRELYEAYPDFYIDVPAEQAAIAAADLLVFLHPLNWYSMPALLKEWFDTVLEPTWAYASLGGALRNKTYWLAVTTGGEAEACDQAGIHCRPFSDFLAPFEQTAATCGMRWLEPHVLLAANTVDEEVVDDHVAGFRRRLESYAAAASLSAVEPDPALHHG
ncbi:MAG: NAD(P)H-dependent oxidoreductase [Massilia sp.]